VYYATRMPRRGKSKKPPVRTGDAYVPLPLPSGVPVPMCFCGDPCKVWILDVCKLCLRSTSSYDPHWVDGENLSFVFNYFDII